MQTTNTAPQPQSEPTKTFQLTGQDLATIILALGIMTGSAGLDANKQLMPMANEALRVARKFGVTL
jgi:hypothetical protein